jgi:CubicO group peptidase (beta-lactamase class C family)
MRTRFMLMSVGLCFTAFAIQIASTGDNPTTSGGNWGGYSAADAARLRRAITLQNWDDGGERSHFAYLHISEIFPTAVIQRSGMVSMLDRAPSAAVGAYPIVTDAGRRTTLAEYIAGDPRVDGFILLHHGRIVFESYPHMRPDDKHLLMSSTKAFIGTAVGILEDQGKIDIQRPIGDYISALKGTDWQAITVRDVLEMASGMEGTSESYTDPTNKHFQYEASLGWQPKTPEMPAAVRNEETYQYLASLKHIRRPGETWAYTSVNTQILAWLLEEVTGKNIAQVLSDEIWAPMGAEADAQIVVNSNGIAVAHGGMATTLHDLARFGLLFTPSWNKTSHRRIISENFLHRITQGGRTDLVHDWVFGSRPPWLDHVAYQFDAVTKKGAFFKGGFGNQFLFVDPQKDVVMAYFCTNLDMSDDKPLPLHIDQMMDDLF